MTPSWMVLAAAASLGAMLASFSATAALRASSGRRWCSGRSACDHCHAPISYAESLPLISYAVLAGRCLHCRRAIDARHPTGEAAGAATSLVAVALLPWQFWAPAVALALALIAIAIYDQATLRIPDFLVLLALPPSIVAAMLRGDLLTSVLGALATSGTLWMIAKLYVQRRGRSGLGMGDVKLVAALCFWTGAMGAAPALAIACGLALILLRLQARPKHEPAAFGPFLAISFWCVGLAGNVQWVS